MLILLTGAALAGSPALTLDTVFDTEGKPGEISAEDADARVERAASRLDALLATDQWYSSDAIPGADAIERYGAFRGRLSTWAHADEWTYTPSKAAMHDGTPEATLSETAWSTRFVQSNVKLVRTEGVVTEVAFFSREVIGERMPSERTVAVWMRFDGGEPVEAMLRSSGVSDDSFTNATHWTFTPSGDGGLTSVTETEVITHRNPGQRYKPLDSSAKLPAPTKRYAVRTWGVANT